MNRTTLSLKKKAPTSNVASPFQPPLNTGISNEPYRVNVASKKTNSIAPPPPLIQAIEAAVQQRTPIFIQMRSGAGYLGLPVHIQDGCVRLIQASIRGTKREVDVDEVIIILGNCGQVAHIHMANKCDLNLGAATAVEVGHAK